MATTHDLLVIGGGIHGAGIAQAAAAGGYSVLVLEQTALAAGTSSRSSKLIHGGLRYLESGQVALVRECLRERSRLLTLAPSLVALRPFMIPVYRHSRRRPWLIQAGLSLYALLGGLSPETRFRRVPKQLWGTLDGLDTTHLQAVFQYQEAQTDDAALTRAVMRSAQSLGAELLMPAMFHGAWLSDEGTRIEYRHQGALRTCAARVLVNAAGPWVQQVLARITPRPSQCDVELVQGTHIIVPGQLTQGMYYVEAPDTRPVFVMPWQGHTLVGTTATRYQGDPAAVVPLPEEEAYLLRTLERYFPQYRAAHSSRTILSAMAGLRVLPKARAKARDGDASVALSHSRETVLHGDRPERPLVLTVYGGKLTTYRLTAERVMQRLASVLPKRTAIADTCQLRIKETA